MGVASALIAQVGFLTKSALKIHFTKFFYRKKVVTNQKPQLLCYVTFFDSLRHFGVIAASQIVYVVCVEKRDGTIKRRHFGAAVWTRPFGRHGTIGHSHSGAAVLVPKKSNVQGSIIFI